MSVSEAKFEKFHTCTVVEAKQVFVRKYKESLMHI